MIYGYIYLITVVRPSVIAVLNISDITNLPTGLLHVTDDVLVYNFKEIKI